MGKATEYTRVAVDKLIPYVNNAKQHSDSQVTKIASSIREFGFLNPVLIDASYNVIAGHGRILAAKKLGLGEVPCLFVEGLTEAQRKAYILADNRLSELGEWDMELVMGELAELDDLGFDTELTGFEFEIEPEIIDDEDDIPEPPTEPRSKLGDLYQLGRHRLICGDSTDPAVIDRLMDGVKADMVFTDPPYRIESGGAGKGCFTESLNKQKADIDFISHFEPEEFLNVLPTIFKNDYANIYIFCNKDLLPDYLTWARDAKLSFNVLVWKKPGAIPINAAHHPDIEYLLFFRKNAIWNYDTDANYSRCLEFGRVAKTEENGKHPTIKPIGLIANELKISSNKNSVVVDFFGGSGSTLIACEQLNRKCYMCELDPKYIDVIIERWENLTGEKAVLISE